MLSVSNYNSSTLSSSTSTTNMSAITTIIEGTGIEVQNPSGPTVTIASKGIFSLEEGDNIQCIDNQDGSFQIDQVNNNPFHIHDTTSGDFMTLESLAQEGIPNPIISAGDQYISSSGEFLTCTVTSTQTSGIRLQPYEIAIVEGGTTQQGNSSIVLNPLGSEINGDDILIGASVGDVSASGSVSFTQNVGVSDPYQLSSPTVAFVAPTSIAITGPTNLTSQSTCSSTIASLTDNSNKIPTTSWVRSLFNQAGPLPEAVQVTTNIDDTTFTIPAQVLFIDIVVVGQGGLIGSQATATGGGFYSGGSGGGGTTVQVDKMLVSQGQQFTLDYAANFTRLSRSGVIIIQIPNGGNGGNATSTAGGTAGAVGADPVFTNLTSLGVTPTFKKGTTGVAGLLNAYPTTAGAPAHKPWVGNELGCGQVQGFSYGRPRVYITYYYLQR